MHDHSIAQRDLGGPARRVSEFSMADDHLAIHWGDGHCSRFHHVWLRDNCRCEQCGDRGGGHRYLELGQLDEHCRPRSAELERGDALVITWAPDGHRSRFELDWLRAHCYSDSERRRRRPEMTPWDGAINHTLEAWEFPRLGDDPQYRLNMFHQLRRFGLARIQDLPDDPQAITQLAAVFGYIRQTHYGHVFDLVSKAEKRILAETSHPIKPHTDEQFRDPVPGLLMMHCLRPSDSGGETILVDGLMAAEKLRQDDPEAFDLLARNPVVHRRFLVDEVDDVALCAAWHTIQTDANGEVTAVHVNERTMAPLDVDEALVTPMYRALKAFLAVLYDEGMYYKRRLEHGEAVVVDNHRVLHGRAGFSGARHIRQCHVDRDEFFSRMRALERRLMNGSGNGAARA